MVYRKSFSRQTEHVQPRTFLISLEQLVNWPTAVQRFWFLSRSVAFCQLCDILYLDEMNSKAEPRQLGERQRRNAVTSDHRNEDIGMTACLEGSEDRDRRLSHSRGFTDGQNAAVGSSGDEHRDAYRWVTCLVDIVVLPSTLRWCCSESKDWSGAGDARSVNVSQIFDCFTLDTVVLEF